MTPGEARARIEALLKGGALGIGLVAATSPAAAETGHPPVDASPADAAPVDGEVGVDLEMMAAMYEAPMTCGVALSPEENDPSVLLAALLLGGAAGAQRRRRSTTTKR